MKKELYRLQANYDGLPLEVMTVIPDNSPRAVLVIHHGMCEHKERYLWFMQQMAESRGVNEQMKAENPMLWVQEMNSIKASAEETVLSDLIYS